jgi:hypothetical protein
MNFSRRRLFFPVQHLLELCSKSLFIRSFGAYISGKVIEIIQTVKIDIVAYHAPYMSYDTPVRCLQRHLQVGRYDEHVDTVGAVAFTHAVDAVLHPVYLRAADHHLFANIHYPL